MKNKIDREYIENAYASLKDLNKWYKERRDIWINEPESANIISYYDGCISASESGLKYFEILLSL